MIEIEHPHFKVSINIGLPSGGEMDKDALQQVLAEHASVAVDDIWSAADRICKLWIERNLIPPREQRTDRTDVPQSDLDDMPLGTMPILERMVVLERELCIQLGLNSFEDLQRGSFARFVTGSTSTAPSASDSTQQPTVSGDEHTYVLRLLCLGPYAVSTLADVTATSGVVVGTERLHSSLPQFCTLATEELLTRLETAGEICW